ncbi:predicted protein [Micromonas commoda]|uniref:PH domain-containing protein n=1 Tax=Micromonas commoda (strain RCC299 / NOUM17 / CCMP2709) TaxID=296587 RepID=C1E234_MICCC|nr:predicted protein [Micromonas commoda]ACO62269.1 predicted protein [Micromonas commoda]|eukprot:XP_002501011.1 predicted protein [Micromonas commoda]
MLKRSEHLKRWKRRWFQADASGDIVEIRGDKAEAKTRSTISLADVRSATVSSTNFHGDSDMKGCCVYLELGTPWRAVFLVADSPAKADAFVNDVRMRAGLDQSLATLPRAFTPAVKTKGAVPAMSQEAANALLAPGLTPVRAPATPSPNASRQQPAARTPGSPLTVSAIANEASPASSAGSARSGLANDSARTPSTANSGASKKVGVGWFGKPSLASSIASVAEQFSKSTDLSQEKMNDMTRMMEGAMRAKDEQLSATNRLLEAECTVAREARGRADALQKRLEEKSAQLDRRTQELASEKISASALRMKYDSVRETAEEETARADEAEASLARVRRELDDAVRELAETRQKADDTQRALMEEGALLQERHARAVATERELRESLDAAERRGDQLARETAELKQRAADLDQDLSNAEDRAVAAADKAAKELEAERKKVAELLHVVRTKRGFLGMFRKTPKASALVEHDEARRSARRGRRAAAALPAPPATAPPALRGGDVQQPPSSDFEFRTATHTPADGSEVSDGSFDAANAVLARRMMRDGVWMNTPRHRRVGGPVIANASTPEAAIIRKRLVYGAVETCEEVIDALDSPHAQGCRQM